jgi:SEC-C motif domain protein
MTVNCDCGSGKSFTTCCGQYLNKECFPKTPEALMRSRYTAYVKRDFDYLQDTCLPAAPRNYEPNKDPIQWLGLEVLYAEMHPKNPEIGFVEFKARYQLQGKEGVLHEKSEFHKKGGRWYYLYKRDYK